MTRSARRIRRAVTRGVLCVGCILFGVAAIAHRGDSDAVLMSEQASEATGGENAIEPSAGLEPRPRLDGQPTSIASGRDVGRPTAGRLRFVANQGQWQSPARYLARSGNTQIAALDDAIALSLLDGETPGRGAVVRLTFQGSEPGCEPRGEDELPGVFHFFYGNDPDQWQTHVPGFATVLYREVYPGIDIRLREGQGLVEYDILVAPGADPDRVSVHCEGADDVRLDADGSLIIETPVGPIRQRPPTVWEVLPSGEPHLLACVYELQGSLRYGFKVEGWHRDRRLIIDPGLEWSTFLGGDSQDGATAVVLAPDGHVLVAGNTSSRDFPVTPGAPQGSFAGVTDSCVTKLTPDASQIVFSTFLGGSSVELQRGIGCDAAGNIALMGSTSSSDFPVTPGAFATSKNIGGDLYVTTLSADGSRLLGSTFLGGSGAENPRGMAVSANGAVTVTGGASSLDFPTTPGAFNPTPIFGGVFVSRLSADMTTLEYSTFLGDGTGMAVAVDDRGAATVAGDANDPLFPVTRNAYQPNFTGLFVSRLDPSGSALEFSTFFGGGSGGVVRAVGVETDGTVTVSGRTTSPLFPTTPGAFNTVYSGLQPGFVSRLDATGSTLLWSTFLAGGLDDVTSLEVDSAGVVTLAGWTRSSGFPTTPGAFQETKAIMLDLFVSRLSADGSDLIYSTFLGGTGDDSIVGHNLIGLAIGPEGEAVVVSTSEASDFPITPGVVDESFEGTHEATVTKLDMLPTGASKYGSSTPGCGGPVAMGVTSMPQVGSTTFALTSTNGPSAALGWLVLGGAELAMPVQAVGADLWVDLSLLSLLIPVATNAKGYATVGAGLPDDPQLAGAEFFVQYFWPDACGPAGWSATNALDVTIQP